MRGCNTGPRREMPGQLHEKYQRRLRARLPCLRHEMSLCLRAHSLTRTRKFVVYRPQNPHLPTTHQLPPHYATVAVRARVSGKGTPPIPTIRPVPLLSRTPSLISASRSPQIHLFLAVNLCCLPHRLLQIPQQSRRHSTNAFPLLPITRSTPSPSTHPPAKPHPRTPSHPIARLNPLHLPPRQVH